MNKNLYKEFFGLKENSIKEAQLVNKITDYQGGVVYKLFDPSTYADVRSDIENFANKKG